MTLEELAPRLNRALEELRAATLAIPEGLRPAVTVTLDFHDGYVHTLTVEPEMPNTIEVPVTPPR